MDTESLVLTHNLIEDLYEQFPTFDRLQELYLSHNQINHLGRGHTFYNLTHLRLLDISHNKFRTLFADVFRGLKRLEVLDLSNGHIKYIDEHAFDGLEMLKELNIENNQLSSIYLELFQSILNLSVSNQFNLVHLSKTYKNSYIYIAWIWQNDRFSVKLLPNLKNCNLFSIFH